MLGNRQSVSVRGGFGSSGFSSNCRNGFLSGRRCTFDSMGTTGRIYRHDKTNTVSIEIVVIVIQAAVHCLKYSLAL